MRILCLDNRPEYFASHRLPLAEAAREEGFDVHVAALTHGEDTPLREAGVSFHALTDRKRTENPVREALLLAQVGRLLRQLEPDILHLITLRAMLYGGLANRFAGVPRVVHSVTGLGYLYASEKKSAKVLRSLVEAGLRVAVNHSLRRVTFQNRDDLRLFREKGIIGAGEGVVIPGSGVDPTRFRPLDPPRDRSPLVVCPTRLIWHKGVGDFVEAARLLLDRGMDATFALVGDTDPDNPGAVSQRQLVEWTETDGLEWWGYRTDMPEVYRQCSVVCFPSRYREGVPKVLLEAAASGRVSVTTDMPGCRDAVEDGRTGLIVPPGDSGAIANAVDRLLRDTALRRKMAERARERAVRHFSIGRIVRLTLAEYESMLSQA